MKPLLRAMAAIFRADFATMLQYRGESVLWAIWGIVYPAVAMAMWQAASSDPQPGSATAAFGREGFAAYFILTMVITHLTAAWDVYEMGYFVRSGSYSGWLLQPLLPIWRSIAGNLAWKTFTTIILAPLWLFVAWWAAPRFDPTGVQVAVGLLSVLLAAVIAYLWSYIVALAAFWLTKTDAVGELWFGGSLLFGGRLAPIELLPGPLYFLAFLMPHQWTLGFPAEVLMGHASAERMASGIAWQAVWIVGGLVAFRYFWAASIKRYSAVGA